jgi:Skp family chaperone for outer membrane proteins
MGLVVRLLIFAAASAALQGCLVKTAVDVATLPVKVVSKGVDLATTSQAEADQKRGRAIRRREEQLGRLQRDHEKLARKCQAGDTRACADDEKVSAQIAELVPSVPVERH